MQERRRSQRISVQQTISIALGSGGQRVPAVSENISSGGVFLHCVRFVPLGSKVDVILVLPLEITRTGSVRVWCRTKVVRIEPQLKEGRFGLALEFLDLQVLPEA